ncbi:MAG: hypothetical protein GY807_12215 [Gammaproteobacteria bacterium]|nr:hypothetical protein [Gammaproteobacteria bacterium]
MNEQVKVQEIKAWAESGLTKPTVERWQVMAKTPAKIVHTVELLREKKVFMASELPRLPMFQTRTRKRYCLGRINWKMSSRRPPFTR